MSNRLQLEDVRTAPHDVEWTTDQQKRVGAKTSWPIRMVKEANRSRALLTRDSGRLVADTRARSE